ncbi:11614_t:CDS:2, partial [Acaulospora morrowiae]
LWVENAISDNMTLTDSILKEMAQKFAVLFNNYEFGATNGWLEGFKKRNNLKSYRKRGEANSIDLDKLPEQLKAWDCVQTQMIISSWTRADILSASTLSIPTTYVIDEIEKIKSEIADLIQHLPIDNPMNVEEYMDIDKNKDIYSSTDENILFQEITLLECDNMLTYIAQKNLNVDYSVIKVLTNLRKKIVQTSIELARQTTLEEYLK